MSNLTGAFDRQTGLFVAGGEPLVFHCHHYVSFFLHTLESAQAYVDVWSIMHNSVQEISYTQFSEFFKQHPALSFEQKLEKIKAYHAYSGYGVIEIESISEYQIWVKSDSNFFVQGWIEKFGQNRSKEKHGVAILTAGYLSGIFDLLFDKPQGTYETLQTECLSKGDKTSRFCVTKRTTPIRLRPSVGIGKVSSKAQVKQYPDANVDYHAVFEALLSVPVNENPQTGLIEEYGVLLSRLYCNYFSAASFSFLHEMKNSMGDEGVVIAEKLLIEAGHVCAFYTTGGMATSAQWYTMMTPYLKNDEDWVHGMIACLNAGMGVGYHEIIELIPNEKMVVRVHNPYESNYFLMRYPRSASPVLFLEIGGMAATMNLVYVGNIQEAPSLTNKLYKDIHQSEECFVGKQTQSRANGDEYDEITVIKKNTLNDEF